LLNPFILKILIPFVSYILLILLILESFNPDPVPRKYPQNTHLGIPVDFYLYMKKMKIDFKFIFPVSQKRIDLHRPNGLRFDHVTDLIVTGTGSKHCNPHVEGFEECYDFDIDEILFEGKNIANLLEALDAKDEINDACFHHIHHLFTGQASDYEVPMIHSTLAKVISLPLRLKAK
jgi:hypothetical protein